MPPVSRRGFLGAGLATAAGLLTGARRASPRPPWAKSVIWLWMDGGMSQIHTWDPKPIPGAPKPIATSVPGIQISELLPLCASQMEHLSIIRTMSNPQGHGPFGRYHMYTGASMASASRQPAIGSILAFELGRQDFPLPKYVSMRLDEEIGSDALGLDCQPFFVGDPSNPIPHIRRIVVRERDDERFKLLQEQNKDWTSKRIQEEVLRISDATARSGILMNTPLLKAFHRDEPAELCKSYGGGGGGFGERCLLARRLVQAGCPFVEIAMKGWAGPWYAHGACMSQVSALDRGLAALVKDLADKKLLAETLVVCATECGRSPSVPSHAADQPWSRGFSIVLAGGPLLGGCVYGDTGPEGLHCDSPVSVQDLHATILSACALDWTRTYLLDGRKMRYTSGAPIEHLF